MKARGAMGTIPDFTDTEQWSIQSAVNERWDKSITELHLADMGLFLKPGDKSRASCSAVFRPVNACNFVVIKVGEGRYRSRFFYGDDIEQQPGTGIEEFDGIAEGVVTLLQAQADYDSVRGGAFPDSG
ncbi:MAG: hypothetical protein GY807_22215 [Gammaproteobacteria bacterium]|nr:hypothetical protein [Gammaproteobacteria bacterium]